MTDTKHAGTPKGYRIDGESKWLLLPSGQEIETESTECEMELWDIRSALAEENALLRKRVEHLEKAMRNISGALKETELPNSLPIKAVVKLAYERVDSALEVKPSAQPECSYKGPHLSHTFGGRPAILCAGIPFTSHKPDCPVMKGHHSTMCSCGDETNALSQDEQ